MTASSPVPAHTLLPLMRYRELAVAIKWLEEAFGFEKQVAVSDADGNVIYAQMTYGAGMIMLGGVRDTDLDKLLRQPDEVGGIETQSVYAVVSDADAHYARAKKAGADIVLELKSDGFGRRGYSCRDPQGHIWNFGTYNPVKGLLGPQPQSTVAAKTSERRQRFGVALAATLALALLGSWWWTDGFGTGPSTELNASVSHQAEQDIARLTEEVAKLRAEKHAAEDKAATAVQLLQETRRAQAAAETALEKEKAARASAESEASSAREELTGTKRARDDALKSLDATKQRSSEVESVQPSMQETSALPEISSAKPDKRRSEKPERNRSFVRRPSMRLSGAKQNNIFAPPIANRTPTYLVDLSEVPWPHSAWYKKRH